MKEATIDVIMPTFERFSTFVHAANSVRKAVVLGVVNKLIISDDSATAAIEEWCANEQWIDYRRVSNRNPGLNRNDCALRSHARYLLFLDSDNSICNYEGLSQLKLILALNKPDIVSITCGKGYTSKKYEERGLHWVRRGFYFNNYIGEVQHLLRREVLIDYPYKVLSGYTLDSPDYLWSRVLVNSSHLFFPIAIQNYSLSKDSISVISYKDKAEPQIFNYVNVIRTNINNRNWFNLLTLRALVRLLFYYFLKKVYAR
jgi:glycosyltransferase involved in cell wall biosynthesis